MQRLCKAETLELDPAKLQKRIEAAHAALQQRVEELASHHDGNPVKEQQAIADALQICTGFKKWSSGLLLRPASKFGHTRHRDGHYETHVPRESRMAQTTLGVGRTRSAHQDCERPDEIGPTERRA